MEYVFLVVPTDDAVELHNVTDDTGGVLPMGAIPLARYVCGNGSLSYIILVEDAIKFALNGYSPDRVISEFVNKHFEEATYDVREN